ncbi:dihydrofolate reductase [Naumannella sp. ID2617S]|nr:dihydrofolate reductase [Naumannella sp. ID2617S]
MNQPITAIAAVAANRVIGADNDLVWRNSDDFKRFKALTMGGALVLGRKNHEAIGRPLPGRESFVVTRNQHWRADGVHVHHDVDAAIDAALATGRRVWILGGGEVYAQAWARTEALEITHVDLALEGDVLFPEIDPAEWTETAREERDGFRWVSYRRVSPA